MPGDIPIDITETCIFVRQPSGDYKEASYKTGEEYSAPMVITDYADPTQRVTVYTHDSQGRFIADTATYKQGSDTLDSLDDEITVNTKGYSTLATYIAGTFVGSIKAYASVDGVNYFAVKIVNRSSASVITEITDAGAYIVNCSGYMHIKLIMNPYTSGAAVVTWAMAMGGGIVESFGASGVVSSVVIRDRLNPSFEAEVDSQNRLKVSIAASTSYSIEVQWADQIGPPIKDMWQQIKSFTIPPGYNMESIRFNCSAANSTSWARSCIEHNLAMFDLDTDVFTDDATIPFPSFAPELALFVEADIGSTSIITITYTNEANVTGRTATITVGNAFKVGHIYPIVLQGDDNGVRDITNIVSSVPLVGGNFHLHGYIQMFVENMTVSGQLYTQFASREAILVPGGATVVMQYKSGQTASVDRTMQGLGTLVPI